MVCGSVHLMWKAVTYCAIFLPAATLTGTQPKSVQTHVYVSEV